MKTENTTESPIYLALNMSKVVNNEESFDLMHSVGPRVCITTATHPGFVGFMANIQTGVLPLAGRYVMAHLIRGPYIMFFQPIMEEADWRSFLS